MNAKEFERRWHELAEDVMTGMAEWRGQHPRATFRQIEQALDERLARMRARMRARMLHAASRSLALERRYGTCPACGAGLFPPG